MGLKEGPQETCVLRERGPGPGPPPGPRLLRSLGHVTPSPSPAFAGQEDRAELILMGFPQRLRSRKTLCFCHRKEKRQTTEGLPNAPCPGHRTARAPGNGG